MVAARQCRSQSLGLKVRKTSVGLDFGHDIVVAKLTDDGSASDRNAYHRRSAPDHAAKAEFGIADAEDDASGNGGNGALHGRGHGVAMETRIVKHS